MNSSRETTGRPLKKAAANGVKSDRASVKSKSESRKGPAVTAKGLRLGSGASSSRAEQLREMLEAKRAEILEEVRRARQDSIESERTSFPEVGDLVSASVEKERAFEYGELGVNALREIDDALERLKSGTYGICEICGSPIGFKRLKVMPSARLCIKCKSQQEASGPGSGSRSQ